MKKNIKTVILVLALCSIVGCQESLSKPQINETETSVEEKIPEPSEVPQPSIKVSEAQISKTETPVPSVASEPPLTTTTDEAESPLPVMPDDTENSLPVISDATENSLPVMPDKSTEQNEVNISKVDVSMPDEVISPHSENFGSPFSSNSELSNEKKGWYFNRNKNHQPPTAQREFDISQFSAYYLGNINEKVVYLTFDEGYENGFTETILDTLKEKNVKAAFFLTKPYIKNNIELVKRMVDEGHLALNHSNTHPSFPTLSDDEIYNELQSTQDYFKEVTGYDMPKFFRPPMGEYSARTLDLTYKMGYKTIFWSFAYKDWEVDNQPGADYAYKTVMNDLHNGSIMLLHAVSKSNTEALSNIIDSIQELGYRFGSLNELN